MENSVKSRKALVICSVWWFYRFLFLPWVTAEVVTGGLGKAGAEWKMTAWEGGVVSIGTVSELLPAEAPMPAEVVNAGLGKTGPEAINGGLGKTGPEAVNGQLEKRGAPEREALCCPSEVPNMG